MALFAYYLLISLLLWVHLGLFFIFAITIIAWLAELDKGNLDVYKRQAQKHGYMYKRVETPGGDVFTYEIANVKRRVRPHLNLSLIHI